MRSTSNFAATGLAWAALALLLSANGGVDASPVFTGDGARAWVYGLNEYRVQEDGRPASIAGVTSIEYTRFRPFEPASVPVTYAAAASSTPNASGANLLELRARATAPDPGDTVGVRTPYPLIELGATWSNVVATVHAPADAAPPGSIRLDFEVAYTRPEAIRTEDWGSQFFHRTETLDVNRGSYLLPSEGGRILEGQTAVREGPDGLLHMGFHLDLPLSADGVSKQFSVSLGARIPALVEMTAIDNVSLMSLSLKGISLPDGTALEAAGYTIGFESGLPAPPEPSIPEPSTWIAWTVIAAGSARLIGRARAA